MTTYATVEELRARIAPTYQSSPEIADDADALKLLRIASELIDFVTMSRSVQAYAVEAELDPLDPTPYTDVLRDGAIDQVEFWLEVGPEHDTAGLRGSLVAGRLQIHPVAPTLGPRARRTLSKGGLYWAGVAAG